MRSDSSPASYACLCQCDHYRILGLDVYLEGEGMLASGGTGRLEKGTGGRKNIVRLLQLSGRKKRRTRKGGRESDENKGSR
jgi:hypothetical protein